MPGRARFLPDVPASTDESAVPVVELRECLQGCLLCGEARSLVGLLGRRHPDVKQGQRPWPCGGLPAPRATPPSRGRWPGHAATLRKAGPFRKGWACGGRTSSAVAREILLPAAYVR